MEWNTDADVTEIIGDDQLQLEHENKKNAEPCAKWLKATSSLPLSELKDSKCFSNLTNSPELAESSKKYVPANTQANI